MPSAFEAELTEFLAKHKLDRADVVVATHIRDSERAETYKPVGQLASGQTVWRKPEAPAPTKPRLRDRLTSRNKD